MTDTTPASAGSETDTLEQERWDWTQVGEQLFDRERATREGHCYATGRGAVEQAIATLTWQQVEPGQTISAPMSPGEAVRSVIAELRLPKVSALAWDGALEVRDDYEGPSTYSLYGIAAHYRNGDAVVYVVDRGTDCLPVAIRFTPRHGTQQAEGSQTAAEQPETDQPGSA